MARAPRKKNTPSSIDRLPKAARETINRLRRDHGWTIDQLLEKLEELGHAEISRSALGRHVRSLSEVTEQMRETQAMAEALARQVGNSSQSDLLDANAQMLQGHLLRLMMAGADGEPVQLSPKEAKDTADAIRSITLARKSDLEVIGKAEERAAAKERLKNADEATKAARSQGLSGETVNAIRYAVLGSDG